jgi:hypothetical protein
MAETLAGMPISARSSCTASPAGTSRRRRRRSRCYDVHEGRVTVTRRDAAEYGCRRCEPAALAGGDAAAQRRRARAVLRGQDRGAHRDALLLGAALALEVTGVETQPRAALARAARGHRRRHCRADCWSSLARFGASVRARHEPGFPRVDACIARVRRASRARCAAQRGGVACDRVAGRRRRRCCAPPRGFDLIAELKLRSPSLGDLSAATLDPVRRLEAYAGAVPRSAPSSPSPIASTAASNTCASRPRRCSPSACRRCARISSSIPTRCSRRAPGAPRACC